ncbi:MAG: DNA cytosine methyltransferase [Thermoplasmatales archaeon]
MDEPFPTIMGVNRPIPSDYRLHPGDATNDLSKIRPLRTAERARIQTFPDIFTFAGTKTDIEQMTGNAVPIKLAEFVASQIIIYNNE